MYLYIYIYIIFYFLFFFLESVSRTDYFANAKSIYIFVSICLFLSFGTSNCTDHLLPKNIVIIQ